MAGRSFTVAAYSSLISIKRLVRRLTFFHSLVRLDLLGLVQRYVPVDCFMFRLISPPGRLSVSSESGDGAPKTNLLGKVSFFHVGL